MEALSPHHLPPVDPHDDHDDNDDKANLEPIPLDRVSFGSGTHAPPQEEAHHHPHHPAYLEALRPSTPPQEAAPADPMSDRPLPPTINSIVVVVVEAYDVLSGRGARVNAQAGNQALRALCACRRAAWEAANMPAKKRLSAELVDAMIQRHGTRFLKAHAHGGWERLSIPQARLKVAQVLRDLGRVNRPGRPARVMPTATATPLAPILELPMGVTANDVLGGRGAWINAHPGNTAWRAWAAAARATFLAGSYAEKRSLAGEVVRRVQAHGGRFVKRRAGAEASSPALPLDDSDAHDTWEELADEQAIQKTCQVMRDLERPDRVEREEKRRLHKLAKRKVTDSTTVRTETNRGTALGEARTSDPLPEAAVPEEDVLLATGPEEEEEDVPTDMVVEQAVAAAAEDLHQQLEDSKAPDFPGHPLYAPEVEPLEEGLLAEEGGVEVPRWI
jgi:hypothetical protein